MCIKQTATQ